MSASPQKIKEKLAKKGQLATLTTFLRAQGANSWEVGTTTQHTAEIAFVPLPLDSRKDVSKILPNTTFSEVAGALMSAVSLPHDPATGSTITDVNGVIWKIATCGRLAPQGINLMWEAVIYR